LLTAVLTSLGEKLSDSEVDELLKGVAVSRDGNVNYTGTYSSGLVSCAESSTYLVVPSIILTIRLRQDYPCAVDIDKDICNDGSIIQQEIL
jgi:hypothetical protein